MMTLQPINQIQIRKIELSVVPTQNIEFLFRSIVTQTQKNVNTAAWQT